MSSSDGESGFAVLDFGATPAREATVTVGGTPIVPEAWISVRLAQIPGTEEHDHLVAPIELRVGDITPGAGFVVHGIVTGPKPQRRYGPPPQNARAPGLVGEFGIAWAWRRPNP